MDLARSALFLLFIHLAFFGTGNVASLSSFSLSSVYRYITIFQPFTMGALLVLKLLIPFLLIITPFTHLNTLLSLPTNGLFMLVVATCDAMTVEFLFRVVNKGSWMEIGLGISHYVICGVFVVFEIALIGISGLLFRGSVSLDSD
jgi:GPI ethanolamine phosphate transferase 1